MSIESARNYFVRVLKNDSTRRAAAAAVAGILISFICEAAWPSA